MRALLAMVVMVAVARLFALAYGALGVGGCAWLLAVMVVVLVCIGGLVVWAVVVAWLGCVVVVAWCDV